MLYNLAMDIKEMTCFFPQSVGFGDFVWDTEQKLQHLSTEAKQTKKL